MSDDDVTVAEAEAAVADLIMTLTGSSSTVKAFEMNLRLRMHPQTWEDIAIDGFHRPAVQVNPNRFGGLYVDTDTDLPFGEIRGRLERTVALR